MTVEQLEKMIKEIQQLYETGIIGERDYEYQYEHYRMQLFELTGE